MIEIYFGLILGALLGLGLAVGCLVISVRSVPVYSEVWIDEACQRAFTAVKKPKR